jgi:hypothetical protein
MKQLGLMCAIKRPDTLKFYQHTVVHEHIRFEFSDILLAKPHRNLDLAANYQPGGIQSDLK